MPDYAVVEYEWVDARLMHDRARLRGLPGKVRSATIVSGARDRDEALTMGAGSPGYYAAFEIPDDLEPIQLKLVPGV